MMNSFNLTLSKKHFICPSILNERKITGNSAEAVLAAHDCSQLNNIQTCSRTAKMVVIRVIF